MNIRISLVLLFGFVGSLAVLAQDEPQQSHFDVGVIEVPDGDTVQIAEFLQELGQLQTDVEKEYREITSEYRQARAKITSARSLAAGKILSDPQATDDQFALAAQFGLTAKVRSVANQPLDQKRRVMEMVKRQLSIGADKGLQRTDLNNASYLVSYLERGGAPNLAIEACDSFASILKGVDDRNAKSTVTRLEGIARRLGLLGNPIEVSGKLLDGSEFNWSDYEGKVVLIDFWATWCGPCIAEAPNVVKNYEKYHDRGFEVVGISLDSKKAALENYVKTKQVPWVNLFQPGAGWKHPMAVRYGVTAIPSVFLVNRDGKVVSLRARGSELGKQLKRLLETKEDWQRAVAEFNQKLEASPNDVDLLAGRANAQISLQQWELAIADWQRAVELKPELATQAFNSLRAAEQWLPAAEFGMKAVEQKPEDIMRWLRVSPVLAASQNHARYAEFCQQLIKQFQDSNDWRDARITCKSCLLIPTATLIDQLPLQKVEQGFEGNHNDYTLAWSRNVQAFIALRSGNAKLALECLEKSAKHQPVPYCQALNNALLALTYHQLGERKKAEQALQSASQSIERFRADEATKHNHDVMIATIMLQEAKAALGKG